VIVRRAVARKSTVETANPSTRGGWPGHSTGRSRFPEGLDRSDHAEQLT
jgi:hypothetical protein